MKAEDRIVVTIDTPDIKVAIDRVHMMLPFTNIFKLGHIQYSSKHFWALVDYIKENDKMIFLDLKLWDIPATVYNTITNLDPELIDFITVRWDAMSKEQVKDFTESWDLQPTLLAVNHLSSNSSDGFFSWEEFQQADGNGFNEVIIASAYMHRLLDSNSSEQKYIKWVPGIRMMGQDHGDHKGVMTPFQAIKNGADRIILGSALFDNCDPVYRASEVWQTVNDFCKDAA